jgi:hypothetical protein
VYRRLGDAVEALREETDLPTIADVAYALRQASELFRGVAVRVEEASETAQKMACAVCVGTSDVTTIRGRWATCTPDMRSSPSLPSPSRDPEAYASMCEFFGVPADGRFRPHWPAIRDWATAELAGGRRVPEFISGAERLEYALIMRGTGALTDEGRR